MSEVTPAMKDARPIIELESRAKVTYTSDEIDYSYDSIVSNNSLTGGGRDTTARLFTIVRRETNKER